MKAMIFAAGKGTRLKPLTDSIPKALVAVNGQPLLELLIRKMAAAGITDIVVNVHHLGQQVIDFLSPPQFPELNISISDERDLLLDTGGGLQKAAAQLRGTEPILLHNVDVLSSLDFNIFEQAFLQSKSMAMLMVKDRPTSRQLMFDEHLRLKGWINHVGGDTIRCGEMTEPEKLLSFSGISMIRPELPSLFTQSGVFGLIPALLNLANTQPVYGCTLQHHWLDVGKPETIPLAAEYVEKYYKNFLA